MCRDNTRELPNTTAEQTLLEPKNGPAWVALVLRLRLVAGTSGRCPGEDLPCKAVGRRRWRKARASAWIEGRTVFQRPSKDEIGEALRFFLLVVLGWKLFLKSWSVVERFCHRQQLLISNAQLVQCF